MKKVNNDQDRIINIINETVTLSSKEVNKLADKILGLFIDIAGERLQTTAQTKADIYEALLTNKMVKDEYLKVIYELYINAKEGAEDVKQ